jgi:ketosteroid isomerase-like protein
MPAPALKAAPQSDHELLEQLNRDYIDAVQNSDVKRFDEILSAEFYCSNPDGSLIDRAAFLAQTAKPVAIRNLRTEDVLIRIFSSAHDLVREPVSTSRDHARGDFAIIHARTAYTKPDGSAGGGRYTDCWARQNGRWLAVSAHVTRL